MASVLDVARFLMGFSGYDPPNKGYGPQIDSPSVEMARRAIGGMIQNIPQTQLRWYLHDLETAQYLADAGNLTMVGQLWRAMRREGVIKGLLETRTSATIHAPKKYYGPKEVVDDLRKEVFQTPDGMSRSVFDEMCPPAELEALLADGLGPGVGIAEFVPVRGREYPVLVRLDPEWLQYRWQESRWYYQSRVALLPVTPGDGRWVLHIPGGRIAPWQWGNWAASGRNFVMKEHAISLRGAFCAGVANPAKIMQSPSGAAEQERRAMFQHLMNWSANMAVELPVGWEMKLLESTGKAHAVFQQEIDTADQNNMILWAGQTTSTVGGSGFSSEALPRAVRGDLIAKDAGAMAYTIATQCLPQYVYRKFGIDAVLAGSCVLFDTTQLKDHAAMVEVLVKLPAAIKALREQFPDLNANEIASRFAIPLLSEDGRMKESKQLPAAIREIDYQDTVKKLQEAANAPADDKEDGTGDEKAPKLRQIA